MMSRALLWIMLALLILSTTPQKSDGQYGQWCIADEQVPDEALLDALDWACGNGADCTKIKDNQPCFFPNTVRDHASYAFNNYYQKFKRRGGSCYFNGAAIVTELDPSHNYCHYELLP